MPSSHAFPRLILRGAAVAMIALLGASCGLKGALYLPDDKAQEVKRSENAKKLPFPVKRTPPTPAPGAEPAAPGTPPANSAPPTPDPDRSASPPPGT